MGAEPLWGLYVQTITVSCRGDLTSSGYLSEVVSRMQGSTYGCLPRSICDAASKM